MSKLYFKWLMLRKFIGNINSQDNSIDTIGQYLTIIIIANENIFDF